MTLVPFEFALRDGFRALSFARHGLADWLRAQDAGSAVIDEVQVAVSELAANAIEASPDGRADIRASVEDHRLRVVVSNDGGSQPFTWTASTAVEDPTALRGRGLRIAAGLADSVEVVTVGRRTEATLIRSLTGA